MPTPVANIPYQKLREMDFTSSKCKKRKLDAQINGLSSGTGCTTTCYSTSNSAATTTTTATTAAADTTSSSAAAITVAGDTSAATAAAPVAITAADATAAATTAPSDTTASASYVPGVTQIKKFFECLYNLNTNSAILSLPPPHNKHFIPKTSTLNLPEPLNRLYSDQHSTLDYKELVSKSKEVFQRMTVTEQQAILIEKAARNQSKSQVWHQTRMGRITASNFHRACHTNPASPSVSLIKTVCYGSTFKSSATNWGCMHEKQALIHYKQVNRNSFN